MRRQEIKKALNSNGIVKINIDKLGEAHIPTAKFTQYALNHDKSPDKATAFKNALGYDLDNVGKLIAKILLKTGETAYIVEVWEPRYIMKIVSKEWKNLRTTALI